MPQKIKEITRGGQITFHNLRMFIQINKTITLVSIILLFASFIPLSYWLIEPGLALFFAKYCIARLLLYIPAIISDPYLNAHTWVIVPIHPPIAAEATWRAYLNPDFYPLIAKFIKQAGVTLLGSLFISIFGTSFFVSWLGKRGRFQTENQFIRGSELGSATDVAKLIRSRNLASDIVIDKFPLIKGAEVQHMLVHGTTGAGKGQLISKILDNIRKKGQRAIIYDKGCTFVQHYYREGKDIILNPFDKRCANWDLWLDALDAPDFENMAESLIPMHGETEPFWVNAARTIFSSVAYAMQDEPDRSIEKLIKLLITDEMEDLERYLEGTEAATLVSGKIEKTAISIRSVLTTFVKSLRFLEGLNQSNKPKFSIRNWVQDESNDSWLFISSNAEQHTAFRPLISMWMSTASISLLGLPENYDRRIYMVLDELASLHKIPQLPETTAEMRKFGGCFLFGLQSIAQLKKIYGQEAAKELFDLLNTRFFFRSPSAEMARIVAMELGEEEVDDTRENYSYGANTIRDGISIGKQRLTRQLVTYSEIMQLEDLECFIKLPIKLPVTKLKLKYEERPKLHAGFLKRNFKEDQALVESIKKAEDKPTDGALKTKKVKKNASHEKMALLNEMDTIEEGATPKTEIKKKNKSGKITEFEKAERTIGIGEI